jgi:hypothetical protein
VWSLKPELWGSLLVQEKYQEENACDKRHPYRIIIIIIITATIFYLLSLLSLPSSSTELKHEYSYTCYPFLYLQWNTMGDLYLYLHNICTMCIYSTCWLQ